MQSDTSRLQVEEKTSRDLKKIRRFDLKEKIHAADLSVLTYECILGFGRFFHVTGKPFQDTMGQDCAKAFHIGRAQESKMGHNVFIKGILRIFSLLTPCHRSILFLKRGFLFQPDNIYRTSNTNISSSIRQKYLFIPQDLIS